MNLLALLGFLVVIKVLYPTLKSLLLYVLPPRDLKKIYAGWVVITGPTDGLGKALAKKFAKRGFNLCLVSRNESKLRATERELRQINSAI